MPLWLVAILLPLSAMIGGLLTVAYLLITTAADADEANERQWQRDQLNSGF